MLSFHWYGFFIGLAVFVAYEVIRKYGKFDEKTLDSLLWWVLPSGILGARAYHVIDFWERYYKNNWWEVLEIWNGGLGIWGGLIGGSLGLLLFTKVKKIDFWQLFDSVAIGVPFGQATGRLGNWANGELYGKNGEPLFAYEAILNVLLGSLLIYFSKNKKSTGGIYLIGYGVIRICLENLRPDSVIWRVGGIPTAIIFGVISILFGVFLVKKLPPQREATN